ncbi:MAG: C-GCAxxG-C-C family protein [Dehalococcoidales bacterium]|nr:C-GCAxxG-C-C family protein [Dehalococcoidales bacterium]
MFGSFEGIIGELRDKVGAPYDAFPAEMMKYGKAGVSGWGTLCGALNGAAAAIYLVSDPKAGDGMIDELFTWYGAEGLPDYHPESPKFDIEPSVAQSPLCHISVTTWCETTGFKALSPERAERCAWLTASVVRHTAELLNATTEGTVIAMPALSAEVSGCLACHGKGGPIENVHASKATSCAICHEPHAIPPR